MKRWKHPALLWLLVAALAVSQSLASAADEPAATIVVSAEPITEAQARAPTSFVSVIDTAAHSEQVETVTDALAESVGVQVRRFGGLGAFSTISIRGSSANQVQIYLDGVPLSHARNETVNLADLPLDALDRIEVYRGTTPVSFGVGGVGGVVNLVTKPPAATPATEASASFGSFTTRKVTASHTQQLAGIDLLAHVTYLGSKGDFTYFDKGQTPGPLDDNPTATRKNNAFDSVEAVLKGGYSLANGLRFDLTNETFFKDQGVPGIGSSKYQSLTASFSELRSLTYARLTQSGLLDNNLDLTGTVFGEYQDEGLVDKKGDLGTGPQDRDDQTTLVGGKTSGTYYPVPSQALGWLAELADERFAGANLLRTKPDDPEQTRLRLTLALQDQASFFDDLLLLVPTGRYEHLDDHVASAATPVGQLLSQQTTSHDLWSPSIGAELRLRSWFALKGNLGRYERAPNFSELFGNSGSVIGNPALRAETSINRDIGCAATVRQVRWLDRLQLEYAFFNNDVTDLIVLIPTSPATFRAANIGAARIRGHEFTVSTSVFEHVGVDTNYTHQDAEDRGDEPDFRGKQLPLRPADELYARVELFGKRGKLYYEFNFVSGNVLNRSNFTEAPSRDIHTVGFSFHQTEWLTFGLEARNITDNHIRDVADFPLPGRALFGTVSVKF